MADGDNKGLFSTIEIDAIGEMMNISLGSSATAASTMLDRKVNITTPRVSVMSRDEFEFTNLEPALAVEIVYVEGLDGKNLMLLRKQDVRKILEILMMTEIPEEDFELDELSMSAVCELMNQMMGSSATAMSEIMGEPVNISTPIAFEVEDVSGFKDKYFDGDSPMVIVSFDLQIEDTLESEFMSMMSIGLVKKMISAFGITEDMMNPSEAAATPTAPAADAAVPPPVPPAAPDPSAYQQPPAADQAAYQQPPPQYAPSPDQQYGAPPQYGAQPQYNVPPQQYGAPPQYNVPPQYGYYPPPDPRVINVQNMASQFDNVTKLNKSEEGNLDLIMSVPLQVSVEIGRTKKQVKDILTLSQGSLVVLDKLAGETVDVFVNGQHVAKGDVVVVDDNFGVRITEIIKNPDLFIKNE